MKKLTILVLTLLMIVTITACGGQMPVTPLEPAPPSQALTQPAQSPASLETPAPVSFENDIMPIFDARCIKCHGVEQTKNGLDMQTYESIFAGSFDGAVLEPGNAVDSLLVQLIVSGKMPKRGPKVTADELKLITDWINQGAANN